MIRQPDKYEAKTIKEWDCDFEANDGSWQPCRPEPSNFMYSWSNRFKVAWDVFTGKADALYWRDR